MHKPACQWCDPHWDRTEQKHKGVEWVPGDQRWFTVRVDMQNEKGLIEHGDNTYTQTYEHRVYAVNTELSECKIHLTIWHPAGQHFLCALVETQQTCCKATTVEAKVSSFIYEFWKSRKK